MKKLRHARSFALLFGATVLFPTVLLANLAYSSISAQEIAFETELSRHGETAAEVVYREMGSIFDRFERTTRERIHAGDSVLTRLDELSPHLKAAFVMNSEGALVAPFRSEQARPPLSETVADAQLRREALAHARDSDHEQALASWKALADTTTSPTAVAEAKLGMARALHALGQSTSALSVLRELKRSSSPSLRDDHFFRVIDLARLLEAEFLKQRDPTAGDAALRTLVSDLLAERWPLTHSGESVIARQALASLGSVKSDPWAVRAQKQVEERAALQAWASPLALELELAGNLQRSHAGDDFHYVARPDSTVLLATINVDNQVYIFAFDQTSVEWSLARITQQHTAENAGLAVEVSRSGLDPDSKPLATRDLAPWLTGYSVVVRPGDRSVIEHQKSDQRHRRLAVIGLALLSTLLGAALLARLIATELEHARMKADFAASVSHELRSPITQIRMKAESLKLGLTYDEDDAQEHYDTILRESERLSRLVDNILDFAAIERGAKSYLLRPGDLGDVLHSQLAAAREVLAAAGLSVEVEIPDDLPVVWMDREAMGQVVTNLLSNAAKYGATGGRLVVRAKQMPARVKFEVTDSGRGISGADLQKIFDPFFRSEDPEVRRQKGTGIGLNIVRYIVEAHGGTIHVSSVLGVGTTFAVLLPLSPPKSADGA